MQIDLDHVTFMYCRPVEFPWRVQPGDVVKTKLGKLFSASGNGTLMVYM